MLTTAVESILNQSFQQFEIIIVDDGSTDMTWDLILSYSDSRIKKIRQENQGESTARNTGLGQAKGEFICFLDDDDYYLPNHLEVLEDSLAKNPEVEVIRTLSSIEIENGEYQNEPLDAQSLLDDPIKNLWMEGSGLTSFTFSRKAIGDIRFFAECYVNEDFYFLMKIILRNPYIIRPVVTTVYREHTGRSVNAVFKSEPHRSYSNGVRCLDRLLQEDGLILKKHVSEQDIEYRKAHLQLIFASNALNEGEYILFGIRALAKSFFLSGRYGLRWKQLKQVSKIPIAVLLWVHKMIVGKRSTVLSHTGK